MTARLPIPLRDGDGGDRFLQMDMHIQHVRRYYIDNEEPGEPISDMLYDIVPRVIADVPGADVQAVMADWRRPTSLPKLDIKSLLDALTHDKLRKRVIAKARKLGMASLEIIQDAEESEAVNDARRNRMTQAKQQVAPPNVSIPRQSNESNAPTQAELPRRFPLAQIQRVERSRAGTIIHGYSASGQPVSARIDTLSSDERRKLESYETKNASTSRSSVL